MEALIESLRSSVWLRTIATALAASWVIAAFAQVTLVLPFNLVPFTLQNVGVFLVATLLGPRVGVSAVALYLVQGFSGLPVFAGASGGLLVFEGVTVGYLFSYLPAAYVVGLLCQNEGRILRRLLGFCTGWVINLGIGGLYIACFLGLRHAWTFGVLPFLLPGACKVIALSCLPNFGLRLMQWLTGQGRQ